MVVETAQQIDDKSKKEKEPHSYWSKDGQFFFTGGYGWGVYLQEVEVVDGRKRYDVKHVCLGKEEEVLAILNGEPMPDTLTEIQREVLTKIVGKESDGRSETTPRAPRLPRSRPVRSLGYRKDLIGRFEARQRLPLRQAGRKAQSLSMR